MPASSPDADLAACRAMMRTGSRSFFAASLLLPRRIYEPATALYAFCRLADDAVDQGGATSDSLDMLQVRLDRAYAGLPCDDPADRALATTVARHQIPRTLLLALLEGFHWDSQGRRYRSLDDLLDYAARVAGSVGAMMAVLMGARSPEALARACDLGVAMQLTNIARDVGEDARAGRLYLPSDWLHQAGLDADDFLALPVMSPELAGVIEQLLLVARGFYARGTGGIALLPRNCRPGIRSAALIYADIGRVLARRGHDSVGHRARVSDSRKAALIGRSLFPAFAALDQRSHAALSACQYLVDAAIQAPAPARRPARAVEARITWLFDLFGRLHEQQWETS